MPFEYIARKAFRFYPYVQSGDARLEPGRDRVDAILLRDLATTQLTYQRADGSGDVFLQASRAAEHEFVACSKIPNVAHLEALIQQRMDEEIG